MHLFICHINEYIIYIIENECIDTCQNNLYCSSDHGKYKFMIDFHKNVRFFFKTVIVLFIKNIFNIQIII